MTTKPMSAAERRKYEAYCRAAGIDAAPRVVRHEDGAAMLRPTRRPWPAYLILLGLGIAAAGILYQLLPGPYVYAFPVLGLLCMLIVRSEMGWAAGAIIAPLLLGVVLTVVPPQNVPGLGALVAMFGPYLDNGPALVEAPPADAPPAAVTTGPAAAWNGGSSRPANSAPPVSVAVPPQPDVVLVITPVPVTAPTAVSVAVDAAAPLAEAVEAISPDAAQGAAEIVVQLAAGFVEGSATGADIAVQVVAAGVDSSAGGAQVATDAAKALIAVDQAVQQAQEAGEVAAEVMPPAVAPAQAASVAASTGAAVAGAVQDVEAAQERVSQAGAGMSDGAKVVAQPASIAAEVGAALACVWKGCK